MNRTEALCKALGWQGGTVHQVAEALGTDTNSILYAEPSSTHTGSLYNTGLYWNTNSAQHQQNDLIPNHRGEVDYWLGVARVIICEAEAKTS